MELQPSVKINLFYLGLIGLNPLRDHLKSKLLSYFSLSCLVVFVVWHSSGIYNVWKGIDSVSESTYLSSIMLIVLKSTSIMYYKANYKRILLLLGEFWPVDHFPDHVQTLKGIHRFTFLTCFMYYCLIYVSSVAIFLLPIIRKTLPFKLHPTCDLASDQCYNFIALLMLFYIYMQCVPAACPFDGLFVAFIGYGSAAIENIKIAIGKLDLKNPEETDEKLNAIVKQHAAVLRFLSEVKVIYSVPLLVFFLFTAGGQVVAFYMLTYDGIVPSLSHLIKFGLMIVVLITQMLYYSLASSVFEEQLATIGDAAYGVDWASRTNPKIRKVLAFIILRSQIDESFTIGKLTKLNLETFVSINRKVLSIYTILRETTF